MSTLSDRVSLAGFDEETGYNNQPCKVEVVTGCINHAYGGEKGFEIDVAVHLERQYLEINGADREKAFGLSATV